MCIEEWKVSMILWRVSVWYERRAVGRGGKHCGTRGKNTVGCEILGKRPRSGGDTFFGVIEFCYQYFRNL